VMDPDELMFWAMIMVTYSAIFGSLAVFGG
jgi:hypothetical protein